MRGGHRNGGKPRGRRALRLTPEQRMLDAIREILGLRPLYAPERHGETAVRIAQDRIDYLAAARAHRSDREHAQHTSVIDDYRID